MTTPKTPPAPLPPSEIDRLAGVARDAWYGESAPDDHPTSWLAAVSAILADPGVLAAAWLAGAEAAFREVLTYAHCKGWDLRRSDLDMPAYPGGASGGEETE